MHKGWKKKAHSYDNHNKTLNQMYCCKIFTFVALEQLHSLLLPLKWINIELKIGCVS